MTQTQEPNVEQLRQRAADLNIEGRSSMDKAALAAAVAKAEASSSSSSSTTQTSPGTSSPPASDDVSARAIDAPVVASTRAPSRRGVPEADAPRAETRGIYHDRDGKRRVLGAGHVIPDGWVRVEDANLAERADAVEDAQSYYPGQEANA